MYSIEAGQFRFCHSEFAETDSFIVAVNFVKSVIGFDKNLEFRGFYEGGYHFESSLGNGVIRRLGR